MPSTIYYRAHNLFHAIGQCAYRHPSTFSVCHHPRHFNLPHSIYSPPTRVAPLLAAPWLWPSNMDVQSQYVLVGPGFPVIPRRLLEYMQKVHGNIYQFQPVNSILQRRGARPNGEGTSSFLVWKPNWGRAGTKITHLNSGPHASSYTWRPWQQNSHSPYQSFVPTSTKTML